MKKSILFYARLCAVTGFILIIMTGCKSSPPKPDADIWTLLQQGDEQAKGFFLGEIDVNAADAMGRTPLHYAAENGNSQLAAFFISLGADVNALDNKNQSPLGVCIENGKSKVAELLAAANADIHLPIKNSTTAAKLAMSKGGAVFKAILNPAALASVDGSGRTILHLASIDGNVWAADDILAVLPSTSISIDKQDNDGKNALDYAFARPDSKNHMETAERLILSGANSENPMFYYFAPAARSANYNFRRSDGLAPIHYAVIDNRTGLMDFLFEKNIDINIKSSSGATPLHEAVRTGNLQITKTLLDRGAAVNSRDAGGNTPLHVGMPVGVHAQLISLLFEKGADPNLRDEHGDTPLHIVITLNRPIQVIQRLLGGGSDVYIRNMQGKTPLYIAVQEKRTDLIPLMLSYGSEVFAADNSGVTPFDAALKEDGIIFNLLVTPETVNQRDSAGNTMLHAAVRNHGTTRQIGLILDQRAFVDAGNRAGDTALHIAVRTNQRENGEYLLSRGSNIFAANAAGESPLYLALAASAGIRQWMINPTTIIARDGLGNNMLHYAAQWNLNNAIPLIIQKGISVDDANASGETPLFMAVKNGNPSAINTLLENRANLNARDKQGNTSLHAAVRWNTKESAALLISSGIDINAHSLNGGTALHEAVLLGMTEIETLLIKEGADLEARDADGSTPFMEAVRAGLLPSAEKLAAGGADTSTRNSRGDTPLHAAVSTERYDLVNMLLNSGASIHARNTRNRTPFQISLNMSDRMVSALLSPQRINNPDDMGNSPLHVALQEKASPEIIRVIINRGARINAVDSSGKSPLRAAVDSGQLETAKILADAGADPFLPAVDNKSPADIALVKGEAYVRALFSGRAINAMDSSANTILHLAARYGDPQIITALIELGANKTIRNISAEVPADIAAKWNRGENVELLK